MKTFHIYRASAGSGKTRTLAKKYLSIALRPGKNRFRHILSVTFTNRATAEMKKRIIEYLHAFADGRGDKSLAMELRKDLSLDERQFQQRARQVLTEILHQYSYFQVSTFDSFFQRVVRSFTREANLSGDFNLELDHTDAIQEIVSSLLDDIRTRKDIREWLLRFSTDELEKNSAWTIDRGLEKFSNYLFAEEYYEKDFSHLQKIDFGKLQKTLRKSKDMFEKKTRALGALAMREIVKNGWTADDFKNKSKKPSIYALVSWAENLQSVEDVEISEAMRNRISEPEQWMSSKQTSVENTSFYQRIIDLYKFIADDESLRNIHTEVFVEKYLYTYAMLHEMAQKLKEYKARRNIVFIGDLSSFLQGIINSGDDAPFIYEKVGVRFKHFLLDEFQDTSRRHWKNFLPLLQEATSKGQECLVVGDVKQSIYRWRGADYRVLQNRIVEDIGKNFKESIELHTLNSNYRSAQNIILFNNGLFKHIAESIPFLSNMYEDVEQKYKGAEEKPQQPLDGEGFVQVQFIKKEKEDKKRDIEQKAAEKMISHIRNLQEVGGSLSDITVLVRNNDEVPVVADYLLGQGWSVNSEESVLLNNASSVHILLAALQYLQNPQDQEINVRFRFFYYAWNKDEKEYGNAVSPTLFQQIQSAEDSSTNEGKSWSAIESMNLDVTRWRDIAKMTLYEAVESSVIFFGLSGKGEDVFLQQFTQLALEFSYQEKNDVGSFLAWWEDNKDTQSIRYQAPNAIQVMTVHKAKGLEFAHVCIPFAYWDIKPYRNILWLSYTTEGQEMSIPIPGVKSLTKTIWEEQYKEEQEHTLLDNINILYVALTRAEKSLWICTEKSAEGGKSSSEYYSIAKILEKNIIHCKMFDNYYDSSKDVFAWGSISHSKTLATEKNELPSYAWRSYDWSEKLSIKKAYAGNALNNEDESVAKGKQWHEILAQVISASDFITLLKRARIDDEEKEKLLILWQDMMRHQRVRDWFSLEWQVITECAILFPGGKTYRMDRFLYKKDRQEAEIIDYKTGKFNPKDIEQVAAYKRQIEKMSYKKVSGYIWYIHLQRVVEVIDETKYIDI